MNACDISELTCGAIAVCQLAIANGDLNGACEQYTAVFTSMTVFVLWL